MELAGKVLTAAAFAALATAAGAGCAGSPAPHTQTRATPSAGAPPSAAPTRMTLRLLGGGRAVRVRACGVLTSYPTYRFGGFVRYAGRVTPPPTGAWSVKVKLKRCIPHGYSESFFEIVRGRADGSFSSIVPKLNPNEFYVRAEYRPSGGGLVLSRPAYFRVVGHG